MLVPEISLPSEVVLEVLTILHSRDPDADISALGFCNAKVEISENCCILSPTMYPSSFVVRAFMSSLPVLLRDQSLNSLPPLLHSLVALTKPQSFIKITLKSPYNPYQ